jgi:hypothetical protein
MQDVIKPEWHQIDRGEKKKNRYASEKENNVKNLRAFSFCVVS